MDLVCVKQILEALLFSSSSPISFKKLVRILQESYPVDRVEVRQLIEALGREYQQEGRSFFIEEIAHGYQMVTKGAYFPYVEKLLGSKKPQRISMAASEVLAIVAYRQPITKQEVEQIRGVDSSQMITTLLDKELVKSVGKKEVVGRPTLFGTTEKFLAHFGLKSLRELPKL